MCQRVTSRLRFQRFFDRQFCRGCGFDPTNHNLHIHDLEFIVAGSGFVGDDTKVSRHFLEIQIQRDKGDQQPVK